MKAYTWIWRQLAAVYCAVGVLGAILVMGWQATLALFVCAVVLGFMCAVGYALLEPYPFWSWVRVGVIAGCFTLGALGTRCLFGPIALLGLVAFGVGAPWTVRMIRLLVANPGGLKQVATAFDPGSPERTTSPGSRGPDEPTTVSDEELCAAWRHSTVALELARNPGSRLELARLRQGYLDELERRNPTGFREWLASGATDPTDYLPRRATE